MLSTFSHFEPTVQPTGNHLFLYFDFDAFFASVEELENSEYKNQPLIVGNRASRSVVSTCNYVARSYGIKSGMPISKALELCPKAIFAYSHFRNYRKHSVKIFSTITQKFKLEVHPLSIDEGFVCLQNVSIKNALKLAKKIQQYIFEKLTFKVSIGISEHFLIAKIFSNQAKPFNVKSCSIKEVQQKLWPLSISELPGIGKRQLENAFKNKFYTIRDLANCDDKKVLNRVFGNFWESLKAVTLGRTLVQDDHIKSRSIAISETLDDLNFSNTQLNSKLTQIFDELYARLQLSLQLCKGITVQLKSNDFIINSHSQTIKKYTRDYSTLLSLTKKLFNRLLGNVQTGLNIRLIGISFFGLKQTTIREDDEKSLFYQYVQAQIKNPKHGFSYDQLIYELNKSFGYEIIKWAQKKIKQD